MSSQRSRVIYVFAVIGLVAVTWAMNRQSNSARSRPTLKDRGSGAAAAAGSSRFWLGIRAAPGPVDVTTGARRGVLVKGVLQGSPAQRAGLQDGDILFAFGDHDLSDPRSLTEAMERVGADRPTPLNVRRGGAFLTLQVTLADSGTQRILDATLTAGLRYLAGRQDASGAYPHFHDREASPAVTALVGYALVLGIDALAGEGGLDGSAERARDAALAWLAERLGEDGVLEDKRRAIAHRSYAVAYALLAFSARGGHERERAKLIAYLTAQQVSEDTGYQATDWRYGAFPYYESHASATLRTDISTAATVAESFALGGLRPGNPAWRRLGLWLDEAQNMAVLSQRPGEREREALVRDGGFAFSPRSSKAGSVVISPELTVYRSYGSATADGLRALIAVDGTASSPRAEAALGWLARHYQLDGNPGLALDGATPWGRGIYFYYLQSLARALLAARVVRLKPRDTGEPPRSWPDELARALALRQAGDGRWQNPSALMNEQDPILSTAFAIIALAAAREATDIADGVELEFTEYVAPKIEETETSGPLRDPLARGLQVYQRIGCRACHKDRYRDNGPSLVGVGDRLLAKYGEPERARSYVKRHIRDPERFPGTRPWRGGSSMPAFSPRSISGPELDDLASFLLSRRGRRLVSGARLPGQARQADGDEGSRLFDRHGCVACHDPQSGSGPDLRGLKQRYVERYGSKAAARAAVSKHIRAPREHPALRPARRPGSPMPAYSERALNDQDLEDLVSFLLNGG